MLPMLDKTLDKLLHDHPRAIGESYAEHAGHALTIGTKMLYSGLACVVHALLPGLFVRTASNTVEDILALMEMRTAAHSEAFGGSATMTENPSN